MSVISSQIVEEDAASRLACGVSVRVTWFLKRVTSSSACLKLMLSTESFAFQFQSALLRTRKGTAQNQNAHTMCWLRCYRPTFWSRISIRLLVQIMKCEICSLHCGDYEDSGLMGMEPCRFAQRYLRFGGVYCFPCQGPSTILGLPGLWTAKQQAPPKRRRLFTKPHGLTSQKT